MTTNAPNEAPTVSDDDVIHLFQIVRRADKNYDPEIEEGATAALYAAFNQYTADNAVHLDDEPRFFAILGRVASDELPDRRLLDRLKDALQEQRVSIELGALDEFDQDDVVEGVSQYLIEDDGTDSPHSPLRSSSPHATSTSDDEPSEDPRVFGDTTTTSDGQMPPSDTIGQGESWELALRPMPENRDSSAMVPAHIPSLSIGEAIAWADECYDRKVQTYARQCLQNWHNRTWDILRVEDQARAHDGYVLLRQSMDTLSLACRGIRQKRYSLLHFAKRVDRINSLLVKDKAFSHWKNTTTMGRDKTQLARRHILRYRCFGSWLSLTLASELLQQNFIRKNFLLKWRHRWLTREQEGVRAIACHQDAVMRRSFKSWALATRERQASRTLPSTQKQRIFYQWADAARKRRLATTSQINLHENSRRDHLFRRWLQRSGQHHALEDTAQVWRRRKLLSGTLTILERASQHRIAFIQACEGSNRRLARTTLSVWHLRATQEAQAAQFYRRRKLPVIWQRFLSAVICRVFPTRLNWRFAAESLYKWRMAYYERLTERECEARLRRGVFGIWVARRQERETDIRLTTEVFEDRKRRVWTRGCLNRMLAATRARQRDDETAQTANARRLSRAALATWPHQAGRLRELQEMARLAQFFLLAKYGFQMLERGFTQSRERRREEGFRLVQNHSRVRILRGSFGRWRGRVALLEQGDLEAEARDEDRVLGTAATAITVWVNRTRSVVEQDGRAVTHRRQHLLKGAFSALTVRHGQLQELELHASAFHLELAAASTTTCLRQLNWRLFQLRRNHESSMALLVRNTEKHMRNMLRYWAERTTNRPRHQTSDTSGPGENPYTADAPATTVETLPLATPARSSETTSTQKDFSMFDNSVFKIRDLDLHLDAFDRDDPKPPPAPPFDPHPDPPSVPAGTRDVNLLGTTPGYLRTPSKRSAARAKTRERLLEQSSRVPTSTPAVRADPGHGTPAGGEGTPFVTPFERKLQAGGYRAGGLAGKSGGGRGKKGGVSFAAFEDVAEE
ncbi:hypothetical protein P152DRAFT_517344 [Eremomyces bilateralis CBS 781.70]|uniref:Sfi1 spindle body domain-containing protein n=1 Tax=Eremomyces bilateralis CBS 781.70 TaxID=1392243 RepID=A0A6G1FSP8_9PEZI|nr:uncharacterized protein P152DRAFT_517344 [Eremomyces bilateralis CBS 781.70]KAF1808711.1 hypothetical protein P152DRAFT_517344 [Eremomyces bilateralis CBS 781.70]